MLKTTSYIKDSSSLFSLVFVLILFTGRTNGFLVSTTPSSATVDLAKRCNQRQSPNPSCRLDTFALYSKEEANEEGEEEPDISNLEQIVGPEKSQMLNYISDFLQKENGESPQSRLRNGDESTSNNNNNDNAEAETDNQVEEFTHLIAIPMGACHELALELESVQRAVLYHCPVLVHSCLVPAIMRMPLLFAKAPPSSNAKEAAESLHNIVQEVVQKHIYVPVESYVEEVDENGDVPLDGSNEDGYRPLVLNFQSLEVDGDNNQALHTVALPDDPGTRRLQHLVMELQHEISTRLNWETSFPPDQHIASSEDSDRHQPPVFRPRVPFMRIPPNFEDYLEPLPEGRDDEAFRTSDEGGNGISPIFWCSWWDDTFGTARCREIAIYARSKAGSGLAEDSFYMPYQMTNLPEGNAALTKQEARFETYQDQRLKQAEYDNQRDIQEQRGLVESSNTVTEEDDPMLERTRARLESLYQQDMVTDTSSRSITKDVTDKIIEKKQQEDANRPKVDTSILDDWTQERIRKANEARGNTMHNYDEEEEEEDKTTDPTKQKTTEDNYVSDNSNNMSEEVSKSMEKTPQNNQDDKFEEELDDSTKERIKKAVESRQAVQSKEKLAAPKNAVPIEENPIFKKYKEGTLVPESKKVDNVETNELPPFPSREHFVGFWKVFSSPTGLPPDDDGGDGSKSENLVLRVDGTTAGGPVLDPETNQKAAGGTWKMISNDEDGAAQLRIRLVIPPKKDRIIVMEGTATKRSMVSLADLPPLAKSTFGIPALEEKLKKANAADESTSLAQEEMLYCSGNVRNDFCARTSC